MTQSPVVRLLLFFATENETAVILRQGPSEVFRLILWDRSTDQFEDGQWIKQKVYIDLCDLSPDGRHFIYFTLNGRWSEESEGAYTVISRPPFFTALALFPEGSTWGGGGRFLDRTTFFASGGADIIGRAEGLARVKRVSSADNAAYGFAFETGESITLTEEQAARADHQSPSPSRTHMRDLYDTQGGVLSRREGMELRPIRDFTKMEFESIHAPYDWRDDTGEPKAAPAPWHPLDKDDAK